MILTKTLNHIYTYVSPKQGDLMATTSITQITGTIKSVAELETLLTCPLSLDTLEDPVIDKCGHTFERQQIQEWLKNNDTCPLSRQRITRADLSPNLMVKKAVGILKQRGRAPDGSVAVANEQEREMVVRAVEQLRPKTLARKQGNCMKSSLTTGPIDKLSSEVRRLTVFRPPPKAVCCLWKCFVKQFFMQFP